MSSDLSTSKTPHPKTGDMGIRTAVLSNGATVMTRHVAGENMVDIGILNPTGSSDEQPNNHAWGSAHFFEHIPFQGTKNYPGTQSIKIVEALGGYLNASTNYEDTIFEAHVPAKDVAQVISVLTDMVCSPLINAADVAQEKEVIHIEWLRTQMDVQRQHFFRTLATAYGDHPALRPVLGSDETILSMTREHLLDFHQRRYQAANCVIAVEGDIDHDQIVEQLEVSFNLGKGTRQQTLSIPYVGGLHNTPQDVPGTGVDLAFSLTNNHDLTRSAGFQILKSVLTGSATSLISDRLREKNKLVYSVGSNSMNIGRDSLFGISFLTFPHKVMQSIELIADAFDEVRRGVAPHLLEQIREAHRNSFSQFMTLPKLGFMRMAYDQMIYGKVIAPNEMLERQMAVTPETLSALAAEMLSQPPTFVARGDVSQTPSYERLCELFHKPSAPKARPAVATATPKL